MKKNIFFALAIITSLVFITSCNDDDPVKPIDTHDDAYGDVLIKKGNMMGEPRFVLMFFAGGTGIIADGSKVIGPDGTEYDLTTFWAGPTTLRNDQTPATSTLTGVGEYKFILKFSDGYTKEITDILTDEAPDLMTGLVVNHTAGSNDVSLSWNHASGSDLYCIKVTELDMSGTKPLFKKAMLGTADSTYTFNTTTSAMPGWMRPPAELVAGTEYWVVISGKKVETNTQVSGASQNFQSNSCMKKKIIW